MVYISMIDYSEKKFFLEMYDKERNNEKSRKTLPRKMWERVKISRDMFDLKRLRFDRQRLLYLSVLFYANLFCLPIARQGHILT